jgi:hypothetical protein
MIFAREINDNLTSLVKKIDAETVKNSKKNMGSFIVFCTDDENLPAKAKEWAKTNGFKECILTVDNPSGPEAYQVAKDAEVTVVLYRNQKVSSNHAFKKGELNDKAIDNIVSEIPKILK